MWLRGGTEDKSGRSVRVSGVTVRAGRVGCQGLAGRTIHLSWPFLMSPGRSGELIIQSTAHRCTCRGKKKR
jgi:hypothetical protein